MKKTLKFLSWMFVAVLSVLSFSSCSDDDEGHPYAGTVWEYEDIYESGTITTRIRFADETKAYYEVEQRNAGGTIVDNTSSPYLDPNKRERQILKALLVKALKWY